MATTVITVRAASDSHALSGATVFINGAIAGITGPSGTLSLTTLNLNTTYSLSSKASGFVTNTIPILGGANASIFLQTAVSPSTVTFNLIVLPESDAQGSVITFDNAGNAQAVVYTVGGIQVPGLTTGPQNLSGTVGTYAPISTTFQVGTGPGQVLQGTITLINTTDTGLSNQRQTTQATDPDTSTLLPAISTQNVPEFIAPNTGQGTYFTMTQARMYIGTMFIDELNGFQFTLQDNKIPIYGYASRFYDAVAQGKSLVQGQFTINFISEGYMYVLLQEYIQKVNTSADAVNKVSQQQNSRLLTLTNALQNPDPSWTPTMIANAKREIQNLAAQLGPAAVNAAKAGIGSSNAKQLSNVLGLAGGDYPNAVYQDIPFDIVLQYTGAGRTVTRRIEDVRLISNESIMDHSGTPILDSYGFIARRAR